MTINRPLRLAALLLLALAVATAGAEARRRRPPPFAIKATAVLRGDNGRGIAGIVKGAKASPLDLGDLVRGKRITLDAGHGGSDTGARGRCLRLNEKDITLAVARLARDTLEDSGAVVSMTRDSDVDVAGPGADDFAELQARVDVGREARADIFVSVHCNANRSGAANGTATYFHEKTWYDRLLALNVQMALVGRGDRCDRGVRAARFYVCRHSPMPAVLVELAFISNQIEEELLADEEFQNEMALGICEGIAGYFHELGIRN